MLQRSFIIFCLFFLLACSSDKTNKYTIGVSQCSDDLWRRSANQEMLLQASLYTGTTLDIKTVKDDTQQQIKDIEWFIEQNVDALIIAPNESEAITPIVQKAQAKGIPVILLDRKINGDKYTAYVGGDNYSIGYEAGVYATKQLKSRGNVFVMRGLDGSTADLERYEGFCKALEQQPQIKIIGERRGDFLLPKAQAEMSEVLEKHVDIDLVFAMNDPMALGVHYACLEYSGKQPFIIGIDALMGKDGGIESIEKGLLDASFIYPTGGYEVIDVAMKILDNKPFQKENILSTAVVDKTNARVIQLQKEQIFAHQGKLEQMTAMLNKSIVQYSNQKTLVYAFGAIIILVAILLILSVIAYRSKSKNNKRLKDRNRVIIQKTKALEEQKEQLIRLSKELEDATHDKLVFFTNISHEFRTPLTLILGPIDSLLASKSLDKKQVELLELIKRNGNSLLSLISQIIEFRTYENDKMNVFLEEDNVMSFIGGLNYLFTDYAKQRQVNFQFVVQDGYSYIVWFDKEKLEKIYFNLLSNAFKHTPIGGNIEIKLERTLQADKEYIILKVFNSGSSIPEEKLNKVFDRFYKVNPNDSGTGIGLAYTLALVNALEGKIEASSLNGVGTTFLILLPIEKIKNAIVDIDQTYKEGYTHDLINSLSISRIDDRIEFAEIDPEKPIVLLIDDNSDMLDYMSYILEDKYNILRSSNGEDGIGKAIKHIPDLIISDVMMPIKNGFEVCKTLKENLSTSHIPIILLTACSLDEQKADGYEQGADAYILKPFNAELLFIRVCKLIETRKKIKLAFSNSLLDNSKKQTLGDVEHAFINSFRQQVESNISDQELSVDQIAQVIGLSRVQLYRKIKSLTDYSPVELMKIIRLKYAIELLNMQSKNISEVAYESGFSSPSYFAKCFKEFYKESPTDYLKRIDSHH